MDALATGIGHLAVFDREIMRVRYSDTRLAGEEAAVPDDDVLLPFDTDAGALGMVGSHVELDAVDRVVRPNPQKGFGPIVAEDHLSLTVRTQNDRQILTSLGHGHVGTGLSS